MRFERTFAAGAEPGTVLRVLSDVERWPEWNRTTRKVDALDPASPVKVGGRYRLEIRGTRPATWTITRLDDRGVEGIGHLRGSHGRRARRQSRRAGHAGDVVDRADGVACEGARLLSPAGCGQEPRDRGSELAARCGGDGSMSFPHPAQDAMIARWNHSPESC
ncbi:MAG: hypothetical protein M0R74_16430 [Dehalococcoidia bacterium]|nr:hypothetical protein [Dehalococcoidia bacterium]